MRDGRVGLMIAHRVSPASAAPGPGEGDAQMLAGVKRGRSSCIRDFFFSDCHEAANIAEDFFFFLCACVDLAAVGSWAKFPPA